MDGGTRARNGHESPRVRSTHGRISPGCDATVAVDSVEIGAALQTVLSQAYEREMTELSKQRMQIGGWSCCPAMLLRW